MEDKNCELLFEYLRSILYDAKIQTLDVKELDLPYQKLGLGLQFLEKAVTEMKDYSEALSRGQLTVNPSSRDNFLCENLKNIHANLNHLTWQTKQVAKGDYSQTVSYLGEFSDAFNTMTRQLKEREAALKTEAEIEREKEARLAAEVYVDQLTGIGNRHFFVEKTEELLASQEAMTLCYCDLDHLKQVNDRYGHLEGDKYLKHFVECVRRCAQEDDIFARMGGDEFCLILRRCKMKYAQKKMIRIQKLFCQQKEQPYEKNFSYGLVSIPRGHGILRVEELIERADAVMYQQKREHKGVE